MEFFEAVDGFGAAVAGAVGGEVAQGRVASLVQGAAEAGDLEDRVVGERGQNHLGGGLALDAAGRVVHRMDALGALPGDTDLLVVLVGIDRFSKPRMIRADAGM